MRKERIFSCPCGLHLIGVDGNYSQHLQFSCPVYERAYKFLKALEMKPLIDSQHILEQEMLTCPYCLGTPHAASPEFYAKWRIKHGFHPAI